MIDVSIKPGYDKKPIAEEFMILIAKILSDNGKSGGKKIKDIVRPEEIEEEEEGSGFGSRALQWLGEILTQNQLKKVWKIDLTSISKFKIDVKDIEKINKEVESFIKPIVGVERAEGEEVGPIEDVAEEVINVLGALQGGDEGDDGGEGVQSLIKKENIDECLKHILTVVPKGILSNDALSYYTMGMKGEEEEDEGEKDDLFNYIITSKYNLLKKIIRPKALKQWGKEYKTKIEKDYVKKLKEFVKSTNCKKEIERYNRGQKYLEKLKDHLEYTKIFTVTDDINSEIDSVLKLYNLEFGGGEKLPDHAPLNSWIFILINGIKKKDYKYLSNSYICRREGVLKEGDGGFEDYFNDRIKYIGQYLSLKIMEINCLVYEKKSVLMTTFEEGDFEELKGKLLDKIDVKEITEIDTGKLTERLKEGEESITKFKKWKGDNMSILAKDI